MNNILKYDMVVDKAFQLSSPYLLETALLQISKEKESIQSALKESGSIKVPIVGDFSSGKSSLINVFIGKSNFLPVDITPETSVAYELYYSLSETVVLYREGVKIEERPIGEIKLLSTRPGDIAKVYVNSTKIKDLELRGITLVDMPGIDSGIKEHNDAILNYINKGTVFILCVDCAGGSLRQSTLAFMTELTKYNLKPAVLVTKTDKKPENEVSEIVEYIEFQSRKIIGSTTFVGRISSHGNNITDFEEFLNKLDVSAIVSEKFVGRITQYLNQQLGALSAQVKIYQTYVENAEKQLEALEEEKLKAATTINGAKVGDTPEKSTQDVLDLVASNLKVHSTEIAQMTIDREDASTINARILNYIRPVIILAFRDEGEQYASAMNTVVDQLSTAMQANMVIDGNLFDNLVDSFREEIIGGVSIAADMLIGSPNVFAQALGVVLQFLGEKVPDVIKWLLGKSKDDILLDVTGKVESTIIPQIIERLRPSILQQIEDQQQRIRENISLTVASSIGNMQDSVIAAKEMSDKEEKAAKINEIHNAIHSIEMLKKEL